MQFWTGKEKSASGTRPFMDRDNANRQLDANGRPRSQSAIRDVPFFRLGRQATLSSASGPKYNLFTCQLVALNTSVTRYDPYQIRHAYHTDLLIGSGFDGKGKTIVIIDAYQSPNIVPQLNFYNAFYGLPTG